MGDYDRRVLRESWKNTFLTVHGEVNGNIEIDKGDFIFLDKADGLRDKGTSTASWKIFPFEKISGVTNTLASNRSLAKTYFLGVAASYSEAGVTEVIGVYIDGLFNYPLKNSRSTKIGYSIIPAGSGVTVYNQKVAVSQVEDDSDKIGNVCDSREFSASVDIRILSQILK